jgi:hypothetical protein
MIKIEPEIALQNQRIEIISLRKEIEKLKATPKLGVFGKDKTLIHETHLTRLEAEKAQKIVKSLAGSLQTVLSEINQNSKESRDASLNVIDSMNNGGKIEILKEALRSLEVEYDALNTEKLGMEQVLLAVRDLRLLDILLASSKAILEGDKEKLHGVTEKIGNACKRLGELFEGDVTEDETEAPLEGRIFYPADDKSGI